MTTAAPIEPETPRSAAYAAGYKAIQSGEHAGANPHAAETVEHRDWEMGFDWARTMGLDFAFVREQINAPPAWSQTPIKAWGDAYPMTAIPFTDAAYWIHAATINVFCVVGTSHARYQGRTWLDMLSKGKKSRCNLVELHRNPGYYPAPDPPGDLYYTTTDGLNYYISQGNHRNCLARFVLAARGQTQLHGVSIHHYHVDTCFYMLYQRLTTAIARHRIRVLLDADRHQLGREDDIGWKIDRYAPYIEWHDLDTGQTRELDRNQALDALIALEGTPKREAAPQTRGLRQTLQAWLARATNQGDT